MECPTRNEKGTLNGRYNDKQTDKTNKYMYKTLGQASSITLKQWYGNSQS